MSLTIDLGPDHSQLLVELPAGHHVTVPATAGGLLILLRLLREQKRADFNEGLSRHDAAWHRFGAIGTAPSPTQAELTHQLDHCDAQLRVTMHIDSCPWCQDAKRQRARAPKEELSPADFD
jgi:hypothetical protein